MHSQRWILKCAAVGVLLLGSLAPLPAVSALFGIEPGKSTRAEAEKVFGAPVKTVSSTRYAYKPTRGNSSIEIEYTDAQLVDRIEVFLAPPLARDAVIRGFNLPTNADGTESREGRLTEYYGGSRSLTLAHADNEASSVVERVSYCSRELFETLSAAVLKPGATNQATSAAVEYSNPQDNPTITQYNPGACQDIYYWAQREYDTVRRGRDVVRRQAVLEVMVTAQRGDCTRARQLADSYKQTHR
jgi:hypothetical protein